MTLSYTFAESSSFTIVHARQIAAKVATDLKRLQRFYGQPSDADINDYEYEVVKLLTAGYLDRVWYGFKRYGSWIEPTLRYTARDLAGSTVADHDPGRVRPGANTDGAAFYSFLTYTAAWSRLTAQEQASFKATLPFQRSSAQEPGLNGYLQDDRIYSAGGRALDRSSVRSY